jgi:hypothetical protein
MVPNILKILTKAIKEKRCAAVRYYNQREIRIVEPHAIYTNERGELVVDCYQTRGFSSSGRPPPFWRPFRLKKIAAISLLKESFEVRKAEGFTANRVKYRNGLVALVEDQLPSFLYPEHVLQEMGPFLPQSGFRK